MHRRILWRVDSVWHVMENIPRANNGREWVDHARVWCSEEKLEDGVIECLKRDPVAKLILVDDFIDLLMVGITCWREEKRVPMGFIGDDGRHFRTFP